VSLALALVLACVIVAKKVDAQAPPPSGSAKASGGGGKATVKLKVAAAPSAAGEHAAPAGSVGAEHAAPEHAAEHAEHKEEEPEVPGSFATAQLQDGGGVPIQTKGAYRSPFANPSWVGEPARVKVGILLQRLHNYDIKEGTFEADFNISLTSDRPMPKMDLQCTNGKIEDREVLADTPTFKLIRMTGTFNSPVDLHDYPFDTQELRIELEDEVAGTDVLKLEADQSRSNLDVGFAVPGWDVSYIEARTLRHYYPDRFDDDDLYYSQYIFKLAITRFGTSAAFQVFVPAFVIVLISLMGLWLPREELEVRANAGAPMLAAAVLFHFALTQALPATAYLTRADKLMMAVYVCLTLNMLSSWAWFMFDEAHTERIFKLGRAIVPLLTVCIMLMGSFI